MKMVPRVSVIIPTFNRERLILETLKSVQNQTFKSWECIIVDDGSTDNSKEVIDKFTAIDSRFKYYFRDKEYPKGASGCRNYGFIISTGDYIQWLDDDDLLSINKLKVQVEELEAYKSQKIVSICDWDLLWPEKPFEAKNLLGNKRELAPHLFFRELGRQQTFVPAHSYLVPRKLAKLAGWWDCKLSLNDDAEYFTRIILNSQKIINTKGCHVLYREHEGKRISRQKDIKNLESLLLSYELIHDHLKNQNIQGEVFFEWKLMKVFHKFWSQYPEILKKHAELFKKNKIDLKMARYYQIKHKIYQEFYPIYKKIKY